MLQNIKNLITGNNNTTRSVQNNQYSENENSLNRVQSDNIIELCKNESVVCKVHDDFLIKESGRYTFTSGDKVLESLYISGDEKKLYVFFTSIDSYGQEDSSRFDRCLWSPYFKGNKIFFDDMSRLELNYASSFFYRVLDETEIIIRKLAISKDIKATDITFIASGSGAFAAGYLANRIEGSNALALSPVISILNSFPKKVRCTEYVETMRIPSNENNRRNPKLGLFNISKNKKSNYFIYFNLMNENDLKQATIIFNYLKLELVPGMTKYRKNIIFWVENDSFSGTSRKLPGLAFSKYIDGTFFEKHEVPDDGMISSILYDNLVPVY